jgi:hypothetical protein
MINNVQQRCLLWKPQNVNSRKSTKQEHGIVTNLEATQGLPINNQMQQTDPWPIWKHLRLLPNPPKNVKVFLFRPWEKKSDLIWTYTARLHFAIYFLVVPLHQISMITW